MGFIVVQGSGFRVVEPSKLLFLKNSNKEQNIVLLSFADWSALTSNPKRVGSTNKGSLRCAGNLGMSRLGDSEGP